MLAVVCCPGQSVIAAASLSFVDLLGQVAGLVFSWAANNKGADSKPQRRSRRQHDRLIGKESCGVEAGFGKIKLPGEQTVVQLLNVQ